MLAYDSYGLWCTYHRTTDRPSLETKLTTTLLGVAFVMRYCASPPPLPTMHLRPKGSVTFPEDYTPLSRDILSGRSRESFHHGTFRVWKTRETSDVRIYLMQILLCSCHLY
jgi:hypothetical protein